MRSVVWSQVGVSRVVVGDEPRTSGPQDTIVDVDVSVLSPGTERARLLGLPTAAVAFPHVPGYMAAGRVRGGGRLPVGARVALRGAGHQSVAIGRPGDLHEVPGGASLTDAAVWQLAITAMYGLDIGGQRAGEPVGVVGAGLLGVIVRRLAAVRGADVVLVTARSTAKSRACAAEPATVFAADPGRWGTRPPLVLDVTGSPDGLDTALAAVAPGGTVVVLGSPRATSAKVALRAAYDRDVQVVGAHTVNLDDHHAAVLTRSFFEFLGKGAFAISDVLEEHPARDAPLVYRRLVTDRTFIGAAFIWPPAARRPSCASA
ncbi:hypothetical protein ACIBKY_46175 [Nonomuraea sp. NPDC050394]|uniref:hypothetical protein n=1 Tax=Nonomuraea sp. NPDC050394 TaxID=3364363 RepID=UPI00379B747F